MVRSGWWKDQLIRAANRMNQHRQSGGKARVVLNGEHVMMSRAKRGIFAGRHIQFGNKISERGKNKSRRTWKPNVVLKRLYSFALDRYIRVHVTTRAIRCIDKKGGLDEYLLNIPDHKMENDLCLYWKRQIQTVTRFMFKLQCGNVPDELNKRILREYAARMAMKAGLPPSSSSIRHKLSAIEDLKPVLTGKELDENEEEEIDETDVADKAVRGIVRPDVNMAGGGGTLVYKKCRSRRGVKLNIRGKHGQIYKFKRRRGPRG